MNTNKEIKYVGKDFDSFKSNLINFTKTYFPNSYSDFSETSPGMLFMELSSYVGDVMSFYVDNQIQENFLQYARQTDNIYALAYMFGYKPRTTGLANVYLDFYQILPAINGQPDFNYSLSIGTNTVVTSKSNPNISFIIEEPIDFSVSSSYDPTTTSIYEISGNIPTRFLLRKTRKAISGNINTSTFSFGSPTEFPTITLTGDNIAGIIDIVDEDNNKWYEVDYLAQDLIYDSIKNTNINDPNNYQDSNDAPYILKTKQVQRRFVTRFLNKRTLQIQFGSGNPSDKDVEILPNPSNVGLGLPFGKNKLTTAYSPLNFVFTNTYGIAPSNTKLTVRYLTGGGVSSNVPSGDLTKISNTYIKFNNSNLNTSISQNVLNSVGVINETAADGGKDGDTIEEIRQNAISNFSSQMRSVTQDDYLIRALSLPSKYGNIAKAYIQKSDAKNKETNLDLYVLSYDINNNLTTSSSTLKNNLKKYLNQSRTIGDTISIKNAFIINIGCEFNIVSLPQYNNNEVLIKCISSLKDYFSIDKWQINQPIILSDLYIILSKIEGVQTVKDIKIINKTGSTSGYSQWAYDIDGANQNKIIYPSLDPSIFELKFPSNDIRGSVSNY